ncbi:DUF2891 family protein [Aestuariimicrobium ganziense]|uniref:DUF2891 family protein n=1 Tax=Aestuariimicrobium ganziense TaxID=2773677 RepID=UPI002E2D069D|nr:DUF2891 family protein [Aestuariimicrobium ganziense]
MNPDDLLARHANGWAATVLQVLRTPWPYGAAHTSTGPDDCEVTPTRLHPMFHGSLDWHSSCHMQWSAIRLLTCGHELDESVRAELVAELDSRLTDEHGRTEADYLRARPGYERPYGWGWLAVLTAQASDVAAGDDALAERATAWHRALAPVADVVADHLVAWLPKLAYPIRHGVHSNTAFGLSLARDGYASLGRDDVVEAIDRAALGWFLDDVDHPSAWEPSGADFLSPSLCEADLVRRILPLREFETWLRTFLPVLAEPDDVLLQTPVVLDRTDGHAVHLYGLALSRAAQLRSLAPHLDRFRAERALEAAAAQTEFGLTDLEHGDFMSTHWLVSFALLGVPQQRD